MSSQSGGMVYTADSKSAAFGLRGSNPLSGTTNLQNPINRALSTIKNQTISDIYSFLLTFLLILSVNTKYKKILYLYSYNTTHNLYFWKYSIILDIAVTTLL